MGGLWFTECDDALSQLPMSLTGPFFPPGLGQCILGWLGPAASWKVSLGLLRAGVEKGMQEPHSGACFLGEGLSHC